MARLITLVLFIPLFAKAQIENGIQFEQDLNWEQILSTAKSQNKYIFVDCYASWCTPCKEMDRSVYSSSKVGKFINAHFISLKLQLDTTGQDNELIKSKYSDSHSFSINYNIYSFPTLLFFSPAGNIVHEEKGATNLEQFVSLASDALNPKKQYFHLLSNYNSGKKDYEELSYLAITAKRLDDLETAKQIAKDYTENYLLLLQNSQLYSKDNLLFIREFLDSSKDPTFTMLFRNTDKIDSIMQNDDFAQAILVFIIGKEEIYPIMFPFGKFINSLKTPNWGKLTSKIAAKYNSTYATRAITEAKVKWYRLKQNWPQFTNSVIKSVASSSQSVKSNAYFINNSAWSIFERSNNKLELNIAISWMEKLFKNETNLNWAAALDTYANLLYKIGKKDQAKMWESRALKLTPDDQDIQTSLFKMSQKSATWPVK